MGKKCVPGLFCIENVTLFILIVILVLIVYFYHRHFSTLQRPPSEPSKVIIVAPPALGAVSTRQDPMNNPYAPPTKSDSLYYPPSFGDVRGAIPVNIETRGLPTSYQQIGILTRVSGSKDMILPLMGRRSMAGRDKWQYYTISNTGSFNTKLPVSVNGKSCTSEYGCDGINNGDTIYVEGYNDTFRATIYETSSFQYIPQL
jgi:hypothetical protein